jgi:hypothetical protein
MPLNISAPMPTTRQRLIMCCRDRRTAFFIENFCVLVDLIIGVDEKYSRFHSIFHSRSNDERNAGILNVTEELARRMRKGRPISAPSNGQNNEHRRGPSVPANFVPTTNRNHH